MKTHKLVQNLVRIIAVLGVILLLLQFVAYVVDKREQAVVMRFGEPVRANTEPGLNFKLPFIESVRMLPSTLQFWGDEESELLPDLPTKDNKKIEIIPWAVWRVNDPIAFVKSMRTMENAEKRVAQFARGATRDVITTYDLEDLVRSTNREMKMAQLEFDESELQLLEQTELPMVAPSNAPKTHGIAGREAILKQINEEARNSLAAKSGEIGSGNRGIELVDVGISHIDFVEKVRNSTFERWIAERETISTRNVKLGEQQSQEIINKTNAEIEEIRGDGTRTASQIRGKADAEVIKRYADAISEVGEFYTFVRTLEAYEISINNETELILTTDNDFLKQFQHMGSVSIPEISLSNTPPTNSQ